MVRSAAPLPASPASPGPAWDVVLQARVGPFRRSKRLRMERTGLEDGRWVRFERREVDGRDHAGWSLDARLEEVQGGTRLVMDLHYDGALWSPPLEHLLQRQIEQGRSRLAELARRGA